MKELVEKIQALYAEFEKDATAQADKETRQLVHAQERYRFHLRRNSSHSARALLRLQNSLRELVRYNAKVESERFFLGVFLLLDPFSLAIGLCVGEHILIGSLLRCPYPCDDLVPEEIETSSCLVARYISVA